MESIFKHECPVCFELTELDGGIITKCGHLYCIECLMELLQEKPECPLCRGHYARKDILSVVDIVKSKKLEPKHKNEYDEEYNDDNASNKNRENSSKLNSV